MKRSTIATSVTVLAVALAVPAFAITFAHPKSATHVIAKSDIETVKGRTVVHLHDTAFGNPDQTIVMCFELPYCTSFGSKIYGLRPNFYHYTKCGDPTHYPQHVYRIDFVPYDCPAPGSEMSADYTTTYIGTSIDIECGDGDDGWTPYP